MKMYLKIKGKKTDDGYKITINMDDQIWELTKNIIETMLNRIQGPIAPVSTLEKADEEINPFEDSIDDSNTMPSKFEEFFEEILNKTATETEN